MDIKSVGTFLVILVKLWTSPLPPQTTLNFELMLMLICMIELWFVLEVSVVSSAYKSILDEVTQSGKPSIKTIKSKGPSMDLWGIP